MFDFLYPCCYIATIVHNERHFNECVVPKATYCGTQSSNCGTQSYKFVVPNATNCGIQSYKLRNPNLQIVVPKATNCGTQMCKLWHLKLQIVAPKATSCGTQSYKFWYSKLQSSSKHNFPTHDKQALLCCMDEWMYRWIECLKINLNLHKVLGFFTPSAQ